MRRCACFSRAANGGAEAIPVSVFDLQLGTLSTENRKPQTENQKKTGQGYPWPALAFPNGINVRNF
jgi:hypothetical protein